MKREPARTLRDALRALAEHEARADRRERLATIREHGRRAPVRVPRPFTYPGRV